MRFVLVVVVVLAVGASNVGAQSLEEETRARPGTNSLDDDSDALQNDTVDDDSDALRGQPLDGPRDSLDDGSMDGGNRPQADWPRFPSE